MYMLGTCGGVTSDPAGHVVGGYVSERDQFTMQNMIESFNRHRLRRVTVRDPPPAFPVGRESPQGVGSGP